MQLRYVSSELGQGLRRNLTMHLAVILTLVVSLTLVGIGLLFQQQATRAADHFGNQLQITVYLCRLNDSNPVCPNPVTEAQKTEIEAVVADNPEVASYRFESGEVALEKAKELYGEELFSGENPALTAEDMPQTIWITLEDPEQYEGISSAVQGLDGVSRVRDLREQVGPILATITKMRTYALGTAGLLVLAALLLVANTIRLAAFARRKEIGIMRLVGASTLYIALPFLLEALVTALVSVALAGGALAAFLRFAIGDLQQNLRFVPWIGWEEFWVAAGAVAVLGPLLTLLPTLVLTRKYLKV
ncbi:cell division protein FtsX [Nocardioides flavus (ex Wang et al. 2016)]|uniref:Cell division protein FtsX n=1 Tax=Nocardioides flavus (ex Wang et al. 2016) TaxID=2058780 RepID=A0ABQ3HME8_9ACTN|nr:permease-like cell division protein FtsX [Nocardioides flavus (ex Wang et al. 2016)]GHE17812.1 cell division protein FtsX [Nocardioides flavus (ex Wang et al. 2016)]